MIRTGDFVIFQGRTYLVDSIEVAKSGTAYLWLSNEDGGEEYAWSGEVCESPEIEGTQHEA